MGRFPYDDPSCGWIETLPPLPLPRQLVGKHRVDCAVIGAGFAGLAAARRLVELRPDWRIAVLEAQRCGFGASGRSSGFIVDLAGFIAAMPEPHADTFIRLSRSGIDQLRELVKRHGIACDWDESGFMHAAASPGGERSLAALRRWLSQREEPHVDLDVIALRQQIGTTYYRDAVLLPGSVQVQPAALIHGLAKNLPQQIDLFESSPIRQCLCGAPHILVGDEGRVIAKRLILTVNAYAPRLGFLRRRIFPLHTFGSLSHPLSQSQLAKLGSANTWGILAQDPLGSTVRLTADRRLLVRNTLRYSPRLKVSRRWVEHAGDCHRRALLARFPQLADLSFEHTWSGVMAASPSPYPFFGPVAKNAVATGGFSGAGIAMGTISGRLLADLLLAESPPLLDDRLRLPQPRWIPPEPFLSPGIRLRLAWMIRRSGADV